MERRLHPFTPLRRAWVPIAATVGVLAQQGDQAGRWVADLSALLRVAAVAGLQGHKTMVDVVRYTHLI